ncbi:MAG: HAD family hydrolase [Saprospiraceae bacterium]|nr:HAD family hydrolase [Pyrinomonadaceae bacterium]
MKQRPAAFIDRDGTLIEEVNFLSRVNDLKLFDYTFEAIDRLKNRGYLILVVTNQSGIGRKIYDEAAMRSIHSELQHRLSDSIDGFYFCPHLPDEGCRCRKPNLGMIETACADFMIDMEKSWMIGDKKIDIETGFNAEIKTALVKTGYGAEHSKDLPRQPDIIAEDLLQAVNQLLAV